MNDMPAIEELSDARLAQLAADRQPNEDVESAKQRVAQLEKAQAAAKAQPMDRSAPDQHHMANRSRSAA